jgi:hypothetical protein
MDEILVVYSSEAVEASLKFIVTRLSVGNIAISHYFGNQSAYSLENLKKFVS